MEVLYEIRGENLIVFLPEELDHHNSRMIMEQCDWYILANQLKNVYLILKEPRLWIVQE